MLIALLGGRRMTVAVGFALCLVVASVAVAQTPAASAIPRVEAVASAPQTATEIAVLKAQLATMQSFTDGLLATVHWSLGAIVGVGVLLVGFGWFSTVRIHEREIEALRSVLLVTLDERLRHVREELAANASASVKAIEDGLGALADSRLKQLVKPFEDGAAVHRASLADIKGTLAKLQAEVEFRAIVGEARYWEWNDVASNEVSSQFERVQWAVRNKNNFEVGEGLQRMTTLLEKGGFQLSQGEVRQMAAVADGLPREFAILVEALRKALANTALY